MHGTDLERTINELSHVDKSMSKVVISISKIDYYYHGDTSVFLVSKTIMPLTLFYEEIFEN